MHKYIIVYKTSNGIPQSAYVVARNKHHAKIIFLASNNIAKLTIIDIIPFNTIFYK